MFNEYVLVSLDLGNSHNKCVVDGNELVLPNYFARASEFATDDIGGNQYNLNYFECMEDENNIYAYGLDIEKTQQPIHTYTSENRYNKKNFKLLFQMTLGLMVKQNNAKIVVVTGLPSSEMGTHLEEQLRNSLLGTHKLIMSDKHGRQIKKHYTVEKVVILAQPVGTFMNLLLTNEGKMQNANLKQDYIGVIDIGGGTTDLDGIRETKTVEMDRHTFRLGMNRFYEQIARNLAKKYPSANITGEKVEMQLRLGSNEYKINNRLTEDITNLKQEVLNELVQDMLSDIDRVWKDKLKFDRIVLTGGGAGLLFPYFQKEYGNLIELVEDGQCSNVRGFYKYGNILIKTL